MGKGIYKHKSSWNKNRNMSDYPQCGFQIGHSGFRLEGLFNEDNASWRGKDVKYRALHTWIASRKGKASNYKCVGCGGQAEEWSNVDHSYLRKLEDFQPLCSRCHKEYDRMRTNLCFQGRIKCKQEDINKIMTNKSKAFIKGILEGFGQGLLVVIAGLGLGLLIYWGLINI